jgi:hypothetical protein
MNQRMVAKNLITASIKSSGEDREMVFYIAPIWDMENLNITDQQAQFEIYFKQTIAISRGVMTSTLA